MTIIHCPTKIKMGLAALALTAMTLPATAAPGKSDFSPKKPNVLFILLDDVGYGQLGAFGGPYQTPNIDAIAAKGLRFSNFHTTALCSPSRAALLTGRNHHSVNMATITEMVSDKPGYTGVIPANAGSLASYLKLAGYETYAFGKWHLTPINEMGPDGPFDRWPTGMGFDYFYGFQGAESSQWEPGLWENTKPAQHPANPGYHLSVDLADRAIKVISEHASDKPMFLYFATGAGHAPHQAPPEDIARNKGKYDQGWDKVREETFSRQKKMGLIPVTAELSPRPDVIKPWDSLSTDEKRVFAGLQEVHAAFIEHADAQIGRVLQALKDSGELENTLIIVTSDNGASGEGSLNGAVNAAKESSGVEETLADKVAMLGKLGSAETYEHYPAGWALAGNTPFRYWKQTTHEGGVRDPLIITWPGKIQDAGAIRDQFGHAIDVLPTILEVVGVQFPDSLAGVAQKPIEGVSMAAALSDSGAESKKQVQYFEMIGNRGLWKDGWKAVAFHGRWPWEIVVEKPLSFEDDVWELYNLKEDPTETKDLSKEEPQKLAELQQLFDEQAKAHQVYPLDDRSLAVRIREANRIFAQGKNSFVFDGPKVRLPDAIAPFTINRGFSVSAMVEIPDEGAEGVLVSDGGKFGGYTLYVKDGKLVYQYNFPGTIYTVTSAENVPAGNITLGMDFQKTGKYQGHATLLINGKKVGTGDIEKTVPFFFSISETFDVGADTITPVSPEYQSPFAFTGKIKKLTVDLLNEAEIPLMTYRD